ncbi:hypothetical protein P20439_2851 [Pseudoalteromonas sp. BSi20439]|nr:hypothetical protein P20439_2851 [Pseudoalteromonas sp. BSi20439]
MGNNFPLAARFYIACCAALFYVSHYLNLFLCRYLFCTIKNAACLSNTLRLLKI